TRLAMRGRHIGDLTHTIARVLRASLAVRTRRLQTVERQLAAFDAGRRLGALRTRLVAADGRIKNSIARRQDRASGRLRATAARLDSLSPLAVLGRGYAVAWDADKTRILRDASTVQVDERVRVTLERGELECAVRAKTDIH